MITKINYKQVSRSRKFPAEKVFHIEGYPQAISDGFAIDLYADDEPVAGILPLKPVQLILDEVKLLTNVLSEPKYLDDDTYTYFIMFNQEKKSVGIQKKYYQYFTARYPGCGFVHGNSRISPIGVRYEGRIIGVVMPVFIRGDIAEYYE